MFTQLSSTADSISKASTMMLRIGTDAHLYDDPDDANIVSLLDSKYDSEKCEALKRLLALIAQGFDVSNFFPQVVKNVASHSIEVKKLVYLYLLHYAEKRPNEALLSINYFQKDLGDPNPLVRAWALRTMAGIRLHVIAQLVLVAVNKCARDPSVYVRKCAANALPKLQDLRLEEHAAAIEEVVGILLNDHSPGVIGAAASAFASVCPNNLSLIGKYYKRLCETLPDVEEWGQIILIGILLRYTIARHGLVKESIMFSSQENGDSRRKGSDACSEVKEDYNNCNNGTAQSEVANIIFRSYLEGPDKYLSRLQYSDKSSAIDDSYFTSARSNDDIKLLVQCTSPLLWSQNSAVVLAAAGVHWIMAPKEDFRRIVKPLIFLLRSSTASKYVVLCNIQVFAKALPSLFSHHFEDFFISSLDPYQIKMLKLDILSSIATESSISSILQEFQDYVRDPDRKFAADTVSAIGLCAQRLPMISNTCLEGLLALTSPESINRDAAAMDEEAVVLIQAINSIKEIIKQHPPSHEKVIAHLIRSLDSIRVPAARAMVIWMVGEYNSVGEIMSKILPTVLQYLAWCFRSEALEAKLQILNACVKVLLHTGETISTFQSLLGYVLDVAKCDLNYDVRDRARLLNHLMSCYTSSDNAKEVKCHEEIGSVSEMLVRHLLEGQFKPSSSQSLTCRYYLPGSLSQLVLHAAPGYEPLPEPRSLVFDEIKSNVIQGTRRPEDEGTQSGSYEEDDESVSGSLDGESTTGYSSRDSETTSTQNGDYGRGSNSEVDDNADPLIHLSDIGNQTNYGEVLQDASGTNDFGDLMSKKALESWLDESSSVDQNSADMSYIKRSSARISIGDLRSRVQRKSHALLNPANGNGLSVDYVFTSEVSTISKLLVCLEVTLKNYSSESISNILLVEEEESSRSPESSDQASVSTSTSWTSSTDVPTLVPMEEILELGPGHITKRMLQVRFHHHLLPLKLVLLCNGKKHPVKFRPDIGYFVKPLPMDADMFVHKESQLPGMFEYKRRCIFSDHVEGLLNNKDNFLVICESLALKILSNTNVHLVSVDLPVASNLDDVSGLRLRFSGEVISKGLPCLITITLDGRCSEPLNASVKVNCEETVFGLNLLNRVVNFLPEHSSQQV
ncbi:membrane traffic protein [Lithospermum erythrorhizon]|uniref:AP-3 complex subunit beta n=1 Tax=Lithospermum erythrorhizon TaxID=34254 RepID=A0AAV3NVE8_LITER